MTNKPNPAPQGKEENQKKSALDFALAQIKKKCGPGSIMYLGAAETQAVPAISTGSLSLDLALGVRGIPRARVTEIFGPEASGKTTLALHVIANAQRNGGTAAFIDAEHALESGLREKTRRESGIAARFAAGLRRAGVDICELLVSSNALDVVGD